MASLVEMAAQIVTANAGSKAMTVDELIADLAKVHQKLKQLDQGEAAPSPEEAKPALTVKEVFRKNEVTCLVCGKSGFKTLARHLTTAHAMKPGEYRKQFGIPRDQRLAAKSYSDARRKMAEERGLVDKLADARQVRAANVAATKASRRGETGKTGPFVKREKPGRGKAKKQSRG